MCAQYYNKNKWVSDHSVEIMWIVFAYGYIKSLQDKTMNMISTDDHQELVLVFMPYYYWLDIDFNGLYVQFKNIY